VMLERFDSLVKIADRHNIDLLVALINGHMSGTYMAPPYQKDRNIFTDPFMLKWQNKFAEAFARRYRHEKRIIAWALGNECNCNGPIPCSEAAWVWMANLTRTFNLFSPGKPVISSMHGVGPVSSDGLWRLEDIGELCDMVSVHPYPDFTPGCFLDEPTDMRTTLHAAAESEMYRGLSRKPCLCEETGSLGDSTYSREESAKFLRLRLYSLLATGNPGCLWWCHSDFTCSDSIPYRWCEMENDGLGLFTVEGKPKSVAKEFETFAGLVNAVGGRLPPVRREAVIVIPREAHTWVPFFNAYVLAKRAGFDADFAWEDADLSPYRLAIALPLQEHAPYPFGGWDNLREFSAKGGTLYLSYNGTNLRQLAKVFGIRFDFKRRKQFQDDIHGLGSSWRYPGLGKWEPRMDVDGGKAILAYSDGRPALVENIFGKGKAILFAEPAEILLGEAPHAYANDQTYRVYDYLRRCAGIPVEVEVDDPDIERTFHRIGEKDAYVVLINHHRQAVSVEVKMLQDVLKAVRIENKQDLSFSGKQIRVPLGPTSGSILHVQFRP